MRGFLEKDRIWILDDKGFSRGLFSVKDLGLGIAPADIIVYREGEEAIAIKTDTREVITHSKDHAEVFKTIINYLKTISDRKKVVIYGSFNIDKPISVDIDMDVEAYGATINLNPDILNYTDHFGFVVNASEFIWRGGRFISSHGDVHPFKITADYITVEDVVMNTNMFIHSNKKAVIRNITFIGDVGGPGIDYGVNITGNNVLVDGYYVFLTKAHQGGFVINYPYDNIIIRNVKVKGDFGSFVHWYIPKSDTQLKGGRVIVENFDVEFEKQPTYGNFAVFPLLDAEGSSGTYSGDFGTIIIKNGKIKGPSVTMVGSENGIGVMSLIDFELSGADYRADIIVENVEIDDMRRFDNEDWVIYNARGRIIIRNLKYKGEWNVTILKESKDCFFTLENSDIDVGNNIINLVASNQDNAEIEAIITNNKLSNIGGLVKGDNLSRLHVRAYGNTNDVKFTYGATDGQVQTLLDGFPPSGRLGDMNIVYDGTNYYLIVHDGSSWKKVTLS